MVAVERGNRGRLGYTEMNALNAWDMERLENLNRRMGFNRKVYRKIKNGVRPVCHYCECKLTIHNSTVDHVIPKSIGGKETVLACKTCNSSKGNMSLIQWVNHCRLIVQKCSDTPIASDWLEIE